MDDGGRKKRHKKHHPEELNVIPLIDITANLLFFLMVGMDLKEQLDTGGKIELPKSSSRNQEETPMVTLMLSKDELLLEGVRQATLKNGKLQNSDLKVDEHRKASIPRLFLELEKKRRAIEASGVDLSVEKNKPVVQFVADRNLDYDVVETVMRTAGNAGFPRFRFAAMMQ